MEEEITGNKFWERKLNCSRLQDFVFSVAENYRSCLGGSDSRALPSTGRECVWDNWTLRDRQPHSLQQQQLGVTLMRVI